MAVELLHIKDLVTKTITLTVDTQSGSYGSEGSRGRPGGRQNQQPGMPDGGINYYSGNKSDHTKWYHSFSFHFFVHDSLAF